MKFLSVLTFAVGALASALPHEKRQTANDFVNGGCKGVVMVYARGSTELGNVGTLGPSLERYMDGYFPNNFAMQGVEYPADLASNFLPDGSNAEAIRTAKNLIERVYNQCPNARIVAGGYSQGSAVISNAVEQLSDAVKARVDGVVFFGYTKNLQNLGRIPGYPRDKLKVYCNFGDMVCSGTLIITPAHLTYLTDTPSAARFLRDAVQL
ncbi:putative cutinase 3 [Ascodesmis nigricans]|uniref:Cutinase n=1 Tax=Ascodesmis nigricans TaxID=341454 RepID=A0A4S2MN44_9PEZI|nr:putative cutinase 3 [Ascodesmis nigricans]